MSVPYPTPGAGRAHLAAVLGLTLQARLTNWAVPDPAIEHPWDAWWLAIRSAGTVRPKSEGHGACRICTTAVAVAIASPVPAHPGHEQQSCRCHRVWAEAMREPLPATALPNLPQRLTVAMLKPSAPRQKIRVRLETEMRPVHVVDRRLNAADCDRLYPDAYGADFVADRTGYLTSSPIQVVVLAGGHDAVTRGVTLKRAIRADLDTEALRNHLHMPDNAAEALADIALLAGWDVLQRLYQRWENDDQRGTARLAAYRAHLGLPPSPAGVDIARRSLSGTAVADRR